MDIHTGSLENVVITCCWDFGRGHHNLTKNRAFVSRTHPDTHPTPQTPLQVQRAGNYPTEISKIILTDRHIQLLVTFLE